MPGVVITEAELRELWQNGKGEIPTFPPGTRFSPSARDFMRDHRLQPAFSPAAQVFHSQRPLSSPSTFVTPTGSAARFEPSPLRPEPPLKSRTIYTERDIDDLVSQGASQLVLDDTVVLTELAQERALRLGLKLAREKALPPTSAVPVSHNLALLPEPPQVAPIKKPVMGKMIYTDVDIEALREKGITRLEINDQVVLTELAREKAARLGIELVRGLPPGPNPTPANDLLFQQVKTGVMARLAGPVDEAVVEAVIRKVLAGLK
jgi:hypothetical protein